MIQNFAGMVIFVSHLFVIFRGIWQYDKEITKENFW